MAHDEANRVAMRAAAETVEKALAVIDGEASALLVVEGTQPDMLAAPFLQRNRAADHFA